MIADLRYASARQKITGQPFFLNYGLPPAIHCNILESNLGAACGSFLYFEMPAN